MCYVEELIGPHTVNTITPATLEAFRDHGQLRASLQDHVDEARETTEALARTGISLSNVTDRLLEDGVTLFSEAFQTLLAAVDRGRRSEIRRRGQHRPERPCARPSSAHSRAWQG